MKTYSVNSLLLLLIFVGCNNNKNNTPENIGKEIVLRLAPEANNPRNSEGDFIKLNSGHLLFVYTKFTGGSGDHAQAHLAGRISTDNGKSWSSSDKVVLPNEGKMNTMSVSLLRLSDNRIAMFYMRKNSETDCIPFMRISNDETKTWGEAKQCIDTKGYYVLNNSRVVQLKNGRIIIPVAQHSAPDYKMNNIGQIMCYYSDNNGETWKKSQQVVNKENVTLQEPGIIELNNGKIMLFCRTDMGVQYFSYSNNKGKNWTPIKPGNINSPLSPATIKRIPSTGDLLLVWNNNFQSVRDGGKRTPFNLAISRDEGKTWEKEKTIESDPDGWYCYTAIEFTGNNVILAHCAGNRKLYNGLETTQITRLSLNWVYDEAISDPVVTSDHKGEIELACKNKDAQIRYTLDGTNPEQSSKLYEKPFSVNQTTVLRMKAFKPGKPNSSIITEYIGSGILQDAKKIHKTLSPGLIYNYFEGEVARTSGIEELQKTESGIISKIDIKKAGECEKFAFIFSGFINIPLDGKYTFHLNSNDGSIFYLDEYLLIENDGPHDAIEMAAPVSLRKGFHPIKLKYFQNGGGKSLNLYWEGPDLQKSEIPESTFFHVE